MIKKVPTESLKEGVFVEKIEQGWFSTPFLFNKFKITSEKQIQKLKDYKIEEVFINTDKGLDVSEEEDDSGIEVSEEVETVEYADIPRTELLSETVLPFDLYIKKDGEHSLYLRKDLPYHAEVQNFLEANNVKTVYIVEGDRELFKKYKVNTRKEKELSEQGLASGFETKEKVEQYNNYLNNYMPVETSLFRPGVQAPINLFVEKKSQVTPIVEANGKIPENEYFIPDEDSKLRKNILIHKNDHAKYKAFVKDLATKKPTGDSKEAKEMRAAVVKENSKLVTKELMENPRSGEAVKEVESAVSDMINSVLENPTSFYGLMKINTYDYYTYLHSVNVCTLAIGLAVSLGMEKEELANLSTGAMMHDVGKSRVPSSLINKPGKLTDQEFIQVKSHVNLGYEVLKEHDNLSEEMLVPLTQHHEKLNGRGYPNGLEGDQVHIFGRICAIVDVYDALTTERSYKKAFKPFDAVNLLAKNPDEFDQKIFKHFVVLLGKQMQQG